MIGSARSFDDLSINDLIKALGKTTDVAISGAQAAGAILRTGDSEAIFESAKFLDTAMAKCRDIASGGRAASDEDVQGGCDLDDDSTWKRNMRYAGEVFGFTFFLQKSESREGAMDHRPVKRTVQDFSRVLNSISKLYVIVSHWPPWKTEESRQLTSLDGSNRPLNSSKYEVDEENFDLDTLLAAARNDDEEHYKTHQVDFMSFLFNSKTNPASLFHNLQEEIPHRVLITLAQLVETVVEFEQLRSDENYRGWFKKMENKIKKGASAVGGGLNRMKECVKRKLGFQQKNQTGASGSQNNAQQIS